MEFFFPPTWTVDRSLRWLIMNRLELVLAPCAVELSGHWDFVLSSKSTLQLVFVCENYPGM